MDLTIEKYDKMITAPDEITSVLIHNSCNMAMLFIGQINGHVRQVWNVGQN